MPRDEFETELSAQPSAHDVGSDVLEAHGRRPAAYRSLLRRVNEEATANRGETDEHEISPPLRRAVTNASLALTGFKRVIADRNLKRSAKYPESHWMTISILAAMVLVEGLINAYFFSKNSDLGLLGGWIQAIVVAFTNVMAAFFLIGFGAIRLAQTSWRKWNDEGGVQFSLSGFIASLTGFVALPIAAAAILVLNKAAAHYRDILELNVADLATGTIIQTAEAGTSPVALALSTTQIVSLEGLLLFVLGVTFACVAAYKGATFDDPVIGFGAAERRLKRSQDQLEHALKHKSKDADPALKDRAARELRKIERLLDRLEAVAGKAADKTLHVEVDEIDDDDLDDEGRRR